MQGRFFFWLAATALLAGTTAAARADDTGVRRALQTNYDRISAAFRAHKPQVMASLLAPDATLTTPDHKTWNRARILSDFGRQSSRIKGATWSRKIVSVDVHKNEAIATVKGHFHGTFSGQDGKPHVFELDALTVDTWVRSGSAWKLKHADTRELKSKIDGNAPPAGMSGHD
ncbi:MAG TPA: nuclear transport factor 2 family protein [Chthonomonadaceae bacterium]|nr:nuclear transport factor 2 family protein [Chthonomonadaceae bacterium]